MNLYNVVKVLQKYEVPARYIDRNTFAIGDRELTVKDDMVFTDVSRWRYRGDKSFFYSLKDERLFYLTKDQMLDMCGHYYILTTKGKIKHEKAYKPQISG